MMDKCKPDEVEYAGVCVGKKPKLSSVDLTGKHWLIIDNHNTGKRDLLYSDKERDIEAIEEEIADAAVSYAEEGKELNIDHLSSASLRRLMDIKSKYRHMQKELKERRTFTGEARRERLKFLEENK